MKSILTTSLLALTTAAFAAETESTSNVTIISTPGATGKATVTIEVNGKKETREIDLGNATRIEVQSDTVTTKTKSAERATWLGVTPDALPEEVAAQVPLAAGTGLLIRAVGEGSPAAKAGLQKNDVLARFEDQVLTNAEQLRTLVTTRKDGDTVRLTYFRQGREATLAVTLAAREGGDTNNPINFYLSGLKNGNWANAPWFKSLGSGLDVIKKSVVIDKDGNVVTPKPSEVIGDAARQLENALKAGGLDEKTVRELKESFAKTTAEIRKAVEAANQARAELTKQTEGAMREAAKAVEEARRVADEARKGK